MNGALGILPTNMSIINSIHKQVDQEEEVLRATYWKNICVIEW